MDRNLTILIAEDDPDYSFLIARALREIGSNNPVHILTDGQEVIDYLHGEGKYADREAYPAPSVMCLDGKMPRVNGFEVLRWVREHPDCAVIPTMIFSSSDNEDHIRTAYELGVNAYFGKTAELWWP